MLALHFIPLQVCTEIENFDECLAHLEQNDWCLERAVNAVMKAQQEAAQQEHDVSDDVAAVPMDSSAFR